MQFRKNQVFLLQFAVKFVVVGQFNNIFFNFAEKR